MPSSSVSAAAVVADEGLMMRMRVRAFVPLFAGLLAMNALLAAPVSAHHGDAAYADKPMEMKGCVVTEFDWMNPHSLIKFDYKTATGEAATAAPVVHVVIAAAPGAVPQAAAVGEHDVVDASNRVLRLRLVDVDRDLVTGRHRCLRPAKQAERRRAAKFGRPMHGLAVVALHVEFDDRVGIRPRELRDGGVLENGDRSVVGGVSVMRERGGSSRQNTRE